MHGNVGVLLQGFDADGHVSLEGRKLADDAQLTVAPEDLLLQLPLALHPLAPKNSQPSEATSDGFGMEFTAVRELWSEMVSAPHRSWQRAGDTRAVLVLAAGPGQQGGAVEPAPDLAVV